MAVPLAGADLSKSAFSVQDTALLVCSKYMRLQSPVSVRLGNGYQAAQQRGADPSATSICASVDADLSDSDSASIVRNGRQRRPAKNPAIRSAGDGPAEWQVLRIPSLPTRRRQHESSQPGRQTFAIYRPNLGPI